MDESVRTVRCPQCGRRTSWAENPSRPFCSERCRLVDLEGWLTGRYVIAGDPDEAATAPDTPDPTEPPTAPPPREKT